MNVIQALDEIKQGKIVEETRTTDRFKYIIDDQTGDLMLYHYNKHYGYVIDNDEFKICFVRDEFKVVDNEIEKNWN